MFPESENNNKNKQIFQLRANTEINPGEILVGLWRLIRFSNRRLRFERSLRSANGQHSKIILTRAY